MRAGSSGADASIGRGARTSSSTATASRAAGNYSARIVVSDDGTGDALDLSGSADQNRDRLGVAIAALVEVARRHGAAIAVETLDFTRARAQLRSSSRRLKRLLSSFAYHKFFAVLSSRCAREDVAVISVNPAWSSVLGQANCAGVRGISVDQGAAAVLARRALGLRERVRPAVARRLPRSAADGHTQC